MNGMNNQERAILDGLEAQRQRDANVPPSDSALRGALDEVPEFLDGDAEEYPGLPFNFVFMFTGSEADIADIDPKYGTFALCDGTSNLAGSGVNLQNKFIVGAGDEYETGGTGTGVGGYKWHGITGSDGENSHNDHKLSHTHSNPIPAPTLCAAAGSDVYAWGSDPSTGICWGETGDVNAWTGDDVGPMVPGDIPTGSTGVAAHSKTDNRPPFYALCFIERIA